MKAVKRSAKSYFSVYLNLSKINIVALILVTTFLGYYMGNKGIGSWERILFTLAGTALAAAGSGALNHFQERKLDALMVRTKTRPLPASLIEPYHALIYGIAMLLVGSTILIWKINLITGFLSIITALLYIGVYTPLKRITWLNTSIGSVPGALPIIGGWTAATGEIGIVAWILFGIMYLWQHPHFFAIAWMCREDYARAGFKMLPVIEPDGVRTIHQIFWHLLLLIPWVTLPAIFGSLGIIYLASSVTLAFLFFLSAIPLYREKSRHGALVLLKSSVFFLPALLIVIMIDLGISK